MIEIRSTSDIPVRYSAFDNPSAVYQLSNESRLSSPYGGLEVSVGHWPMPNEYWPDLTDGLYFELCSYQGLAWQINITFTAPTRQRQQVNLHTLRQDRQSAFDESIIIISEMLNSWQSEKSCDSLSVIVSKYQTTERIESDYSQSIDLAPTSVGSVNLDLFDE